jgi:cytochrome b6-f complex iron-sulfur subunit
MTRRRFTAFVEALVQDRRPRSFRPDPGDVEAMRAAIELRASQGDAAAPSPQFVNDLHDRLRRDLQQQQPSEHQPSENHGSEPGPSEHPLFERARVSRRWLLEGAGVAAAAGVAVAIDRTAFAPSHQTGLPSAQQQLVPDAGTWQPVGPRASVAQGAVTRFDTAGAVGFVTEERGTLLAVSGICSHQGCLLQLNQPAQRLDCPCHRAAFSLSGRVLFSQLPTPPGPLPRLEVRDHNGQVEVYLPRPV